MSPSLDCFEGADLAEELEILLSDHSAGKPFRVREIRIDDSAAFTWVKIASSPKRFVPEVFVGDWAVAGKHPSPGIYRVLALVDCHDGVCRAVVRDGQHLFAYPFI